MAGRKLMLLVCVFSVLIAGLFILPGHSLAMGQATAPSVEATGEFAATIVDPTGAAIPGAIVTLTRAGAPSVTATSDSAGVVLILNLQPGDYAVEARANGFSAVKRPHVVIPAGHGFGRLECSRISTNTNLKGNRR